MAWTITGQEYNDMLLSKVSGTSNSIYQERYLTVSIHKKNVDEARTYFARVGTDIVTHLAKLSSVAEELDAGERLQLFRDFFKTDEPSAFPFDLKAFAKKGHSFKDWICPESMEFHSDHFRINGRYGRVLYMQDYASYVKDDMVSELCDLSRDLMLSIDILPVPTDEAVREDPEQAAWCGDQRDELAEAAECPTITSLRWFLMTWSFRGKRQKKCWRI